MAEVGSYLKRVAVPLFLGALASLALTFLFWNSDRVILIVSSAVVLSVVAAVLILVKSPHFARWAVITSGILVIASVVFAASMTRSSFQWLVNFPAWAVGPVYWALLRECRKDESGINLLSWAIFIAIDVVIVGLIVGKFA